MKNYQILRIFYFVLCFHFINQIFGEKTHDTIKVVDIGCNNTLVLEQVKLYLEREDINEALALQGRGEGIWMNPNTLWMNLLRLNDDGVNLCDSSEAKYLQMFCGNRQEFYLATRNYWLTRFTHNDTEERIQTLRHYIIWTGFQLEINRHRWIRGRPLWPLNFCSLIPPEPIPEDFDAEDFGRVLGRMIDENTVTRTNDTLRVPIKFSQQIEDRIKRDDEGQGDVEAEWTGERKNGVYPSTIRTIWEWNIDTVTVTFTPLTSPPSPVHTVLYSS